MTTQLSPQNLRPTKILDLDRSTLQARMCKLKIHKH
jgi:hypothetical protein